MENRPKSQVNGAPPRSGWARMVVELHVNDLGRSLSFWRDVLGFQTAFERAEERFVYLEHPEGHKSCFAGGMAASKPGLCTYLLAKAPYSKSISRISHQCFRRSRSEIGQFTSDPERCGVGQVTGRADRKRFLCRTRMDTSLWSLTILAKDPRCFVR
jgi:hypothetical protein